MVNFHDPVVVVLDSCMYASCGFAAWKTNGRYLQGAFVKLCHAVDGLYLCAFPSAPTFRAMELNMLFKAGSFSLPSATSGVSSEVIAHTGGRYGSVFLRPSVVHAWVRADLPLR